MCIYLITRSIRKWFLLTYKVKISCLINSCHSYQCTVNYKACTINVIKKSLQKSVISPNFTRYGG